MFPSIHDESQYRISTIRYILTVTLILSHRSRRYSMLHPSYHALPPHLMTYLHPRYIPLDTISGNSPHIISSLYLSITYPHPPPSSSYSLRYTAMRHDGRYPDTPQHIPHISFRRILYIPPDIIYSHRSRRYISLPPLYDLLLFTHPPPPFYLYFL